MNPAGFRDKLLGDVWTADLHLHSKWSIATSSGATLGEFHRWAQLKGLHVLGTGDVTHPAWFDELRRNLVEAAPGLHRLRASLARKCSGDVPSSCASTVQFMLTGEINSVFARDGRSRRMHCLILLPAFKVAAKVNARLAAYGRLDSDGRPSLRIDPRDLLDLLLQIDPRCALIPAHIWTPWYSLLGARSGFDSVEAVFGELTAEIFALETGLSSDPPMNWQVRALDRFALVSNSDAHAPQRLGRKATLFRVAPDYDVWLRGLRRKDPAVCGGTADLFPEEGKYYRDGHRGCGVALTPDQSRRIGGRCPNCGRPLTKGVAHRVQELADRPPGAVAPGALPCRHLVPLDELLAEILNASPGSARVAAARDSALAALGPELHILLFASPDEVSRKGWPQLAEALRRSRSGNVNCEAGYDGRPGHVRVF